ncbi:MAG: helix-turn-helix domain-containing protein [Fimbriimonadaceae bacterium]
MPPVPYDPSLPSPQDARPLWGNGRGCRTLSLRTAQRLCDLTALAVSAAFAVPAREVVARSRRSSAAAFARQSAMYLAHVSFGLSFSEVGRGFGRDRTTASHACKLIEDRRDDPAVDALLASLECACAALRRKLDVSPGAVS